MLVVIVTQPLRFLSKQTASIYSRCTPHQLHFHSVWFLPGLSADFQYLLSATESTQVWMLCERDAFVQVLPLSSFVRDWQDASRLKQRQLQCLLCTLIQRVCDQLYEAGCEDRFSTACRRSEHQLTQWYCCRLDCVVVRYPFSRLPFLNFPWRIPFARPPLFLSVYRRISRCCSVASKTRLLRYGYNLGFYFCCASFGWQFRLG